MNNASNIIKVFCCRFLHQNLPTQYLKKKTAINETHPTVKGKNGAYIEHQAWIFFYLFCQISSSSTIY